MTTKNLQHFVIIWLDATLKRKHFADYVVKESSGLRRVINDLKLFTDCDSCLEFLMHPQRRNEKIFLVISGSLGEHFVPRIHSTVPEVDSIYIFCSYIEKHKIWAKNFDKIKGVYKETLPICEQLREDVVQYSNNLFNMKISSTKQEALPDYNQLDNEVSRLVDIDPNATWIQDGVTVAGGNGDGNDLNQLSFPFGLDIDDNQTVYVTDLKNDRIVEWKSGVISGQVVAGGNGEGDRLDQLNSPADVIVDKELDCLIICDWQNQRVVRWPCRNGLHGETIISNVKCRGITMNNQGFIYVSNWETNEVKRWKMNGSCEETVAGGNGEGDRLNQLRFPGYLCIGPDESVYVSDWANHRVMKWKKGAKDGIVVAGGQGEGNALTQLKYPYGIVVDQRETLYVVDCGNHRVMRWVKGSLEGTVIVGGNGEGGQKNQLNFPAGLAFDQFGNLYTADTDNCRVQKFSIDHHG